MRTHHIGKLSAAAIVVAGAVVWTTSSSEPFTPTITEQLQPLAVKPVVLPSAEPSFFFDDEADALERNFAGNPAEHTATTAPDNASQAITDFPDFRPNGVALATNPLTDRLTDQLTNELTDGVTISEEPDLPSQGIGANDTKPLTAGEPQAALSVALLTDQATMPEQSDDAANRLEPTDSLPRSAGTDAPKGGVQFVTVSSGDTLSGILNRHGLKVDQMHQLLTNELVKEHLSNIDVGQVLKLTRDDTGQFSNLTVKVANDRRVNIDRTASGFDVTTKELPLERRRVVSSGMINQSLYLAAEQANLKQSTIMELANIFQWELDFAREIRKGDKFSLVYDRLYREGEYIGDGNILAAEFVRGGRSYKAIRFTTDDDTTGYFTPEGKSKRRAFLRHPVDVVRITSKFDPNRLHPVLHQIRAHRGVDYGSPHGSPIYATADGKIIYSGSKNAYGNTVVLKHGEKFSTLYAHMSRISDKSEVGARVKQGDVIGYVGKTGRVTGTHLHYEFRVNGKQIDPLKVELPEAQPIDSKYLSELKALADEMTGLMDQSLQGADNRVATVAPAFQND